jgi:hypothetical protein
MSTEELVLEYFRVFLSPQVVIGVVVCIFLWSFGNDIRALMGRILNIRFPGGELSTSQAERSTAEKAATKTVEQNPSALVPASPPAKLPGKAEDAGVLIASEREVAKLWEFRYLTYYLVPQTQHVLDILARQPPPSRNLFDTLWMPFIPSADERQAIIGALQMHGLIHIENDLIHVTDKGRQYLQWRSQLPKPPAALFGR